MNEERQEEGCRAGVKEDVEAHEQWCGEDSEVEKADLARKERGRRDKYIRGTEKKRWGRRGIRS